jgi:hypothetical protein
VKFSDRENLSDEMLDNIQMQGSRLFRTITRVNSKDTPNYPKSSVNSRAPSKVSGNTSNVMAAIPSRQGRSGLTGAELLSKGVNQGPRQVRSASTE